MTKKFTIKVTETLIREIEVFAETEDDALEMVDNLCNSDVIDLTDHDFDCRDFDVLKEKELIDSGEDTSLEEKTYFIYEYDRNFQIIPFKFLQKAIIQLHNKFDLNYEHHRRGSYLGFNDLYEFSDTTEAETHPRIFDYKNDNIYRGMTLEQCEEVIDYLKENPYAIL